MEINWFPGHMAKSMRDIEKSLSVADCALYVLDCRAVRSCFNPAFDRMLSLPIVYILNKADTVDSSCVSAWTDKLSKGGNIAISTLGADKSSKARIVSAVKKACAPVLERQKKRGLNTHLRAVVIGVPNTGKSTLINCLCGRAKLDTGDRAGVTRSAQWTRVDETLDVLDTPGTLYPKITDRAVGENLAIVGSIRDEVLDKAELAVALISRLNAIDGNILAARYGKKIEAAGGLDTIAAARSFRMKGGSLDTDRAAAALIDDYRKGRLGKIALERCNE